MRRYPDRVTYRVEVQGECFFVKHYCPTDLWGRSKSFLLRRQPQRAHRLGLQLASCGVPTPRTLGLFGKGLPLAREMLLVNEWAADCEKWSEHLGGRVGKALHRDAFNNALTDLAGLLGNLHRLGMYHGDLATNLYFGRTNAPFRPLLVDLEAIRRSAPQRRLRKNLGELARSARKIPGFSTRDYWRFMTAYAEARGMALDSARSLWRDIRVSQTRRLEQRRRRAP